MWKDVGRCSCCQRAPAWSAPHRSGSEGDPWSTPANPRRAISRRLCCRISPLWRGGVAIGRSGEGTTPSISDRGRVCSCGDGELWNRVLMLSNLHGGTVAACGGLSQLANRRIRRSQVRGSQYVSWTTINPTHPVTRVSTRQVKHLRVCSPSLLASQDQPRGSG